MFGSETLVKSPKCRRASRAPSRAAGFRGDSASIQRGGEGGTLADGGAAGDVMPGSCGMNGGSADGSGRLLGSENGGKLLGSENGGKLLGSENGGNGRCGSEGVTVEGIGSGLGCA